MNAQTARSLANMAHELLSAAAARGDTVRAAKFDRWQNHYSLRAAELERREAMLMAFADVVTASNRKVA